MARTLHHAPYDVQLAAAWGPTEPTPYIDPLTGDEYAWGHWKNARADRVARGVGTVEHLPGARLGGSNPKRLRVCWERPRHLPTPADFAYDEVAEAAYLDEQRYLDELSRDLQNDSLNDWAALDAEWDAHVVENDPWNLEYWDD